jgi:small redox-active disulfide protein 2
MIIKILGSGCKNCQRLAANVKEAVSELGIDAQVVKVESIQEIMNYNIMRTPALVIDEVVKTAGVIPSVDEIKKLIQG